MLDQTIKNFESRIENLQNNVYALYQQQSENLNTLVTIKDLLFHFQTVELQNKHPNPLNKFGTKCFSQTDEDGITLEILRRLNIQNGSYAEFGVGNGLENNTLILASLGWKGFWVGGENLAFNYERATKFSYIKDWITLDNISSHYSNGLSKLGETDVDVLSLDLDGNDIYFVEELLAKQKANPKLLIVEYNAKFPPPAKFQIDYDPRHVWQADDYFGAALTNFVEMLDKYDYKLICCNSQTGGNAFFIDKQYAHLFTDVPSRVEDIYVPPRYYLYTRYGHTVSARVVEKIINQA